MEEELKSLIKVWVSAVISVSYCYYFSTRIKAGVLRLLSVLPVCALFLLLPLFFSDYVYDYKQYLSPNVLLLLYSLHIYLELEIVLMLVKVLVFISLGCDLEQQSNEPYLATSLQDFWGRRWNLMVPAILREAVNKPVRQIAECKMSSDQARLLAIVATFMVSGAVHELLFFYCTLEMPTGEVTCFFVLHGICTAVEVAVKKRKFVQRWRLSPMVSRLLTVGFVMMTSGWLFFPPLLRTGMLERLTSEAFLFFDFVKCKFFICGL